jgi:hypothetical protein
MRHSRRPFPLLIALLMSGVAGHALASEAAAPTALAENESILLPIAERGNVLPTYPQAVLVQPHEPKTICMRVDIGEDGKVTYAGPVLDQPGCDPYTELTKQFSDAATAALSQWTFEPAVKCVFRNARAKEAAGMSCQGGKEKPTAISLPYRFIFAQENGQGVVRMAR